MYNNIAAELKVLEYKLDVIRRFAEAQVAADEQNIAMQGVLELIKRYEEVPSNWTLERPLVIKPEGAE